MNMKCDAVWRSPIENCVVVSLNIPDIKNKTVDFREAIYSADKYKKSINNLLVFGVDVLFKDTIELKPFIADECGNYCWRCDPNKLSLKEKQEIIYFALKHENEYEVKHEVLSDIWSM